MNSLLKQSIMLVHGFRATLKAHLSPAPFQAEHEISEFQNYLCILHLHIQMTTHYLL
jgi:hypothetical protein